MTHAKHIGMKSLTEIKAEVDRLAAIIGSAGHHSLPTYRDSDDSGRPHIEVDSRGYHFVVAERGMELSRFTTGDLDDLLNQVFEAVTFNLASEFELTHRIAAQDFRRLLCERQVALLSQLSAHWAERQAQKHQRIFRAHPVDDNSLTRATLTCELTADGHSPQAACALACERYPLPRAASQRNEPSFE
jgi:hypothetical protein